MLGGVELVILGRGHVWFGFLLPLDIIRIKSIFDNASENSNTIEIYTHANNKNQTV